MVRPLREYFASVARSDVHDYGWDHVVQDFLWPCEQHADWIITNPPFRLGCEFALTAMDHARIGVAMLVRTAFLESIGRYERLFSKHRPAVLQFTERVPMFKGRLDAKGSTATAYCWLVWTRPYGDVLRRMDWIPPCRKALERPGDYGKAA
ncbi:MAG: methyltransferase [Planctomycetes bacterium]|nr:methyltransferase [Planctomycetota bacterium]